MIFERKHRLRRLIVAALLASSVGVFATSRADDTPSHFVGPAITTPAATTPVAAPAVVTAPPTPGVARPVVPASSVAPLLHPVRPYWPELTASQREALAPLVDDWERLDDQTKKKWVEIANRYPRMQPDERIRTQERMREWALLTPDQRRVARDSFARIHAMPPEQRADLLRKYRELSPEKKQALEHQAQVGKALVVPKPAAMPNAATITRREQIREGAKVRNPALAAAKSASPVVTPAVTLPVAPSATPTEFQPKPASPPAVVATPAVVPATGTALASPTSTAAPSGFGPAPAGVPPPALPPAPAVKPAS